METVFERNFRKDSALCLPGETDALQQPSAGLHLCRWQGTFLSRDAGVYRESEKVGIHAHVDVYPTGFHAFDMLLPFRKISHRAITEFAKQYPYAVEHYRAAQKD